MTWKLKPQEKADSASQACCWQMYGMQNFWRVCFLWLCEDGFQPCLHLQPGPWSLLQAFVEPQVLKSAALRGLEKLSDADHKAIAPPLCHFAPFWRPPLGQVISEHNLWETLMISAHSKRLAIPVLFQHVSYAMFTCARNRINADFLCRTSRKYWILCSHMANGI